MQEYSSSSEDKLLRYYKNREQIGLASFFADIYTSDGLEICFRSILAVSYEGLLLQMEGSAFILIRYGQMFADGALQCSLFLAGCACRTLEEGLFRM